VLTVDAFADELRQLLADRNLSATVLVDGGHHAFRAPRVALLRSVTNLVKNGLEATAPGGADPVVALEGSGAWVRIHVDDDGAGMTHDVFALAGEPFFTTKGEGKGLGLGVFLARELAEGLDGALTFERRAPRGLRATLAWPRLDSSTAIP
jgi:two-component system sensor histidine kinase RegB